MLETDARYAGSDASATRTKACTTSCAAGSRRFRACNPPCSPAGCRWRLIGSAPRRRRRQTGDRESSVCRRHGLGGSRVLRDAAHSHPDGRAFDERDRADTPRVAVISETMAREYFGSGRRRRPPLPARVGPRLLDRSHRRGAATPDGRPVGRSRRSAPQFYLSLRNGTRCPPPCSRARRSMRPDSWPPCSASCATVNTTLPVDLGEDDGAVSRGRR